MRIAWAWLAFLLPMAARAEQRPVPILTYHRFDPELVRASTVVTTPVFEAQVAWLVANRIRVVPLRDVVAGTPIAQAAIAITADDGFRSVYTQMFPIIRREGMPVTLFINPPMISGGSAYLTWAMIEEMRQSGLVDVEAHTQAHPNFNAERVQRGPEDFAAFVTEQISGSRQMIRERLGVSADLLAWPYGIHDAQLEAAAAQAGFVAAFALGSRAAGPGDDVFAIPRYQVYNSDVGGRFAAIVEGHPRGKGVLHDHARATLRADPLPPAERERASGP